MDNDKIKSLLGSDYKDGMTSDQMLEALSKHDYVDLSSGNYVTKAKADASQAAAEKYSKQLDDLKRSSMTEQEKIAADKKTLEDEVKTLHHYVNKTDVKNVLVSNGLSQENSGLDAAGYDAFIEGLVGDDHDKSVEMASKIASILNTRASTVEKKAKDDAIKSTTVEPKAEQKLTDVSSIDQQIADFEAGKGNISQAQYIALQNKKVQTQNKI